MASTTTRSRSLPERADNEAPEYLRIQVWPGRQTVEYVRADNDGELRRRTREALNFAEERARVMRADNSLGSALAYEDMARKLERALDA